MTRRPRADALRNAERLRDAAREVFGRAGTQAPLEDVARRAGVSIGTLYNHFPRRESLLEAVLPDVAERQWERIRDAAAVAPTPADRFAAFLDEVFAVQAEDRLLSDAFASPDPLPAAAAAARDRVIDLGVRLLAEAQEAGTALLLEPSSLQALLVANSIVQRGPVPAGWAALLDTLARARLTDPSAPAATT